MSLWPFGKNKKADKSEAPELNQIEAIENQQTESTASPKETLIDEPIKDSNEEDDVKNEAATQDASIEAVQTQPTEEPHTTNSELGNNNDEAKGWLGRLKSGLGKSSTKLGVGLKQIFIARKLDDEMLEELEDLLIASDFGVKTATAIVQELSKSKYDKEISDDEVREVLASHITQKLKPLTQPLTVKADKSPHVILFCGVNGAGKTTTIGKFANQFMKEGKKVMVAAGDTYRAAAVEQLAEWAKRSGCGFIKGKENADPASVAYTALEQAKAENADVLLIDTAGRLQNKSNLMEQLVKVVRVIKKIDETAPHDAVIVLDATTGQNAHSQVKIFSEMIGITGMIITKLDGTARGGVVVGLATEYQLPIHAIGVGESIEDLRAFEAESFAKSLVG